MVTEKSESIWLLLFSCHLYKDGRMMIMKCYVISLGCCKNLVDSEQIAGLLGSAGVTFVNRPSRADLIWINTCGFIESASIYYNYFCLFWIICYLIKFIYCS